MWRAEAFFGFGDEEGRLARIRHAPALLRGPLALRFLPILLPRARIDALDDFEFHGEHCLSQCRTNGHEGAMFPFYFS